QLKLGVLDAKLAQNLVARLAHYASTRIVVFVNTVAKAHQFEGIIFIFCFSNEFFNVGNIANFIKHFKYGFVGSTVSRTPERGNTSSNSCIRVGARRTSHAHSRVEAFCSWSACKIKMRSMACATTGDTW